MSSKPGRNAPCPCGSGKKYKRCCLDADEAAARERARLEASDEDDVDLDFDDADEFVDVEDDPPLLEIDDIVRVCYTRGLVRKLSHLRSGRDVQVTEWEAPDIPSGVLESIEQEAVADLEGEWGHPKAGNPIQVDIIDLETDNDVVTIQVFNRGIALLHADSEKVRRIHRVCGVIARAATDGQAANDSDRPTEVVVLPEALKGFAAIDMPSVIKAVRRQGGTCELCGEALTRQGARRHLAACAPAHDLKKGADQQLVHVRATAPGLPAYWLDFETEADAKLEAVDSFLRGIWLECCGHLSAFTIGGVKYFSRGYDFGFTDAFADFGARRMAERSMSARLDDVLPAIGERFEYEYDFGSTTTLQLTVVDERTGRVGRPRVRLLARNIAPAWPCATCGQPATVVCSYCAHDERVAFSCAAHMGEHACGETEGLLPVVNSPRSGVCAYGVED